MASLKEVKSRIASVRSTRKITSAMKMVASSKLHRAGVAIENMRPYEANIRRMLTGFLGSLEGEYASPYSVVRPAQRIAVILYTSNSSLCGGFNANAIKAFHKAVETHRQAGAEIVAIYTFGKKGLDAVKKAGFDNIHDMSAQNDHPGYANITCLADALMKDFTSDEIDRVELIYHHFKSTATQVLTNEAMLPLEIPHSVSHTGGAVNYIVEPSVESVIDELIPATLRLKLFTALLDSLASEHAARVIAMQVATDNADELLRELTLTYNKTRQQAITAELLDIVGGSMQ